MRGTVATGDNSKLSLYARFKMIASRVCENCSFYKFAKPERVKLFLLQFLLKLRKNRLDEWHTRLKSSLYYGENKFTEIKVENDSDCFRGSPPTDQLGDLDSN